MDPILQRLQPPKVIDLTLERLRQALDSLGRPQDRLPPVVHVAGTNGKGSTIATLRACLEASGRRVHAFTSPHLIKPAEMIRLGGRIIADDDALALLDEVRAAGQSLTFFEAMTAAALLAFSRTPADMLLLEAGLGARNDATALAERVALSVLTPVSLDHQAFLGSTLSAIAADKSHVIRPGIPCICAHQPAEVLTVIEARAQAVGARLWLQDRDWSVRAKDGGMIYESLAWRLALPLPALTGAHQIDNAGLALACLERLAVPLAEQELAAGLRAISWPGRLQFLSTGPLARSLPAEWELWLDGGHNPAAGAVLAEQARIWTDRPLYLVFGMLSTKDILATLKPLAPHVASLRAVSIPGDPLSLPAAQVAEGARQAGIARVGTAEGVTQALADLAKEPGPARVLVCGSLYLAGHVLGMAA